MKKKERNIVVVIVLIVAVIGLSFGMLNSFVDPYLSVDAVVENPGLYMGRQIQVKGALEPDSLTVTLDNVTLVIVGETHTLLVLVTGVLPDLTEAQSIVAIGLLHEDGYIIAQDLLAQCPSKYETNSTTASG
ncbi:MAG: cytochrome c maturation protein CcmE [Candidatus Thorarchaeota archaeon]|nr:cytochrome c maturation protein CcmE [Candidatus Thorarchaeota archaeon]